MPRQSPVVHVQLKVSPETHQRLRRQATLEQKSMHQMILDVIDAYLGATAPWRLVRPEHPGTE